MNSSCRTEGSKHTHDLGISMNWLSVFMPSEMAYKAEAKRCDKIFWSNPVLLKTQFHNLKAPLHTRFTEVKTVGSVNTSWGGTFRVKLVNLQAFSVADNIWAHIKSVRSDGCGTSSALSHW